MSRSGSNRRRTRDEGRRTKDENDLIGKEAYFEIFVVSILFVFGVYHSVLYFGHQAVPNPDFSAFVNVGHELLSFEVPSSFKRVPVLGLLQVGLGYLVGGQHPDLTAGWLLNAILHPLNAVLLWLVGRRIVGKAAVWIAAIAIINPWVIYALRDPIVETTLLFFVLLTFYLILRRSSWSYLLASITTMVRYEGAALILGAFVIDMILRKTKKERLMALLYSTLASVPLIIWMGATFMDFHGRDSTHYLKEFGAASGGKFILPEYIRLLWEVGFHPLFTSATATKAMFIRPTAAEVQSIKTFFGATQILAAGTFAFGAIYGLCKRRWNILALLIFLVPYFIVHALHSFIYHRFMTTVYWMVLLICFFGVQSCWKLINKDDRIAKPIIIILQGILLIIAFVWLLKLLPYLPKLAPISRRSVSIPYVAMGVVALIFAARVVLYRTRYLWRDIAVSALVCLVVVSNQVVLARTVGNGQRDVEFKLLADWYIANAKPGEKILTTMSNIVSIYAPEHKASLLPTGSIKADNPTDFVRKCYDEEISYIAWDSRVGFSVGGRYYKLWGLKNIAVLAKPQTIGPYEFITQIRVNERRFINIFRLRKPSPRPATGRN